MCVTSVIMYHKCVCVGGGGGGVCVSETDW